MLDQPARLANLRTVLILAHQCQPFERPGSRAGAQRVYQFAKYLPEFGWRVEILCCPHDVADEGRHVELPSGSSIRAIGAQSRVPVLERVRIHLDRRSTSSFVAALRRAVTAVTLVISGDWSSPWRKPAEAAARLRVEAGRASEDAIAIDALIGEHSPDAGMIAAALVARSHNVPLVLDFRDPLLLRHRSKIARRFALAAYSRHLRAAVATTNVQVDWVEDDRRTFGTPAFWVPHGFDEDEYSGRVLPASPDRSSFRIAMYGALYDFYDFGPTVSGLKLFLASLSETERRQVEFKYWGANWATAEREYGGLPCACSFNPQVDKADLLDGLAVCAAILIPTLPSALRTGSWSNGLAPSKLMELLPLGVPCVVAPGDGGNLDEFCRMTGVGQIAPESATVLTRLRTIWDAWNNGGSRPASEIEVDEIARTDFTRRRSAQRMAAVLDYAVTGAER